VSHPKVRELLGLEPVKPAEPEEETPAEPQEGPPAEEEQATEEQDPSGDSTEETPE
jgi:hypothetical protein